MFFIYIGVFYLVFFFLWIFLVEMLIIEREARPVTLHWRQYPNQILLLGKKKQIRTKWLSCVLYGQVTGLLDTYLA